MSHIADSLIPDWINKIKEQREQHAVRLERDALRAQLSAKVIQVDGPEFWRQLLKELEITIRGLEHIGVQAKMDRISTKPEYGFQVSFINDSAHVNIFYSHGGGVIRCHPSDEESCSLRLSVHDGRIMLAGGDGLMSPEQAAQYIIEPMVNRL